MVGPGGSSAGSYLADPTSPIPSHCASIVVTSTLGVNNPCKEVCRDILFQLYSLVFSKDDKSFYQTDKG